MYGLVYVCFTNGDDDGSADNADGDSKDNDSNDDDTDSYSE